MAGLQQRSATTGCEEARDDPVRRWHLIATGTVLGFVVGEAQVLILEHLAS
ncbi:hypothetical protein [Saccharopolyspora spinosa]|uniref:hypothetical protein n=1 Tax=Saccharopolyspora spinosa TaxID=60894 RepID=UPI0003064D11|nr:hypothetical protein [Saccharopolyspora spinosa]